MSSLNDVVTNTNSIIHENLVKLYEKMTKLKGSIEEDEDYEYENFYNRINFYFSTIVTELKLNFIENTKVYQQREIEYKCVIKKLKEHKKTNEKDIIRLLMDNMLLRIENDSYEEKNLLNISHYVDVSQPLSDQSLNSKEATNLIINKTNSKQKTNNSKSRNKPVDEISFKTELKNNLNLKIQEKLQPNISKDCVKKKYPMNITSTNNPSNNNNSQSKKKKRCSNLTNFLSNANVMNSNFQYRSFNNGITYQKNKSELIMNTFENNNKRKKQRTNLTVEKSMCNLPCYSLTKLQAPQDNYIQSSLNDLGIKANKLLITSSNTQLRAKSGNNIKKSSHFIHNANASRNSNVNQLNPNTQIRINKAGLNIHNITTLNAHLNNPNADFEKYKSSLLTKINIMPNVKKINLTTKLQKGNASGDY